MVVIECSDQPGVLSSGPRSYHFEAALGGLNTFHRATLNHNVGSKYCVP